MYVCLKGENVQIAMFDWNAKVTKGKYQKQSTKSKIKKNKTTAILGASLFGKKANYIIPTINYYPRNGSGLEL